MSYLYINFNRQILFVGRSLKMDNDSNKFVVLEGFNHEYFKVDMLVVVRPKPDEIVTLNSHYNAQPLYFNMIKDTLCGDQFVVGYIRGLSETSMDICVPSTTGGYNFTLNASDRDKFVVDRLEDCVILNKSEYEKLKGGSLEWMK